MTPRCIGYSVGFAVGQAVEANDATCHVNDMVVEVDAAAFAAVDAAAAIGATVGVYVDMEQRLAGEYAEKSADRANRIA